MDWDDFKFFTAVAHSSSVRKAAVQLGVHASTVARRLDHFERRLGVRLFIRTHSGLQITPEGAQVVQQVDKVAAQLGDIQRRLQHRDADMAGIVRITLAEVFAASLLTHDFAGFAARYPQVRLEFIPAHQAPDLARREVDVAIVVTGDPPEDMIGRRLGTYTVAVYASRSYLDSHDPWLRPKDCAWIGTNPGTALATSLRSTHFAKIPDGVWCDDLTLQLAAIEGDMGVGVLPCAQGDSAPGLTRVAGVAPREEQDVWMLIHPDVRSLARVQALLEFLQRSFDDHRERLLGAVETVTETT